MGYSSEKYKISEEDFKRIFYHSLNFSRTKASIGVLLKGLLKFFRELFYFLKAQFNRKKVSHFITRINGGGYIVVISTFNQLDIVDRLNFDKQNTLYILSGKQFVRDYMKNYLLWNDLKFSSNPGKQKIQLNNVKWFRFNKVWGNLDQIFGFRYYLNSIIELVGKTDPKCVVLLNDHSIIQSCFIVASRYAKFKTAYIQHGMTTDKFPPLEFDLTFLYGIESKNRYRFSKHKVGTCYEVGKVYNHYQIKEQGRGKLIGLSLNLLDNTDDILEFLQNLKKNGHHEILVKPHPRMTLDPGILKLGVKVYDSPGLAGYFHQIDIHFASQSSIHLDSLYFKTPSFSVDLNDNGYSDYYGFIKSGLIPEVRKDDLNFSEIRNIVNDYFSQERLRIASLYQKNILTGTDSAEEIMKIITTI